MEKQNVKCGSMNRFANFVQNAELSSETKDYLVCLGMLEDLDTRMYELLVRDLGEEQVSEDKCGVWSKWRDSTDKVRSLIMENFTDKLMMNLGDLHSKSL